MTNKEIAELFRKVAVVYQIRDERKYHFQIIAYLNAADAIEKEERNLIEIWKENKLKNIPGIGEKIHQYLVELFTNNKVTHFETIFKEIPSGVFDLLKIPGIGPKKAVKIVNNLDLVKSKNIFLDLKMKLFKNKLAQIEGFGDRSEQEILVNLENFLKGRGRKKQILLSKAEQIADKLFQYLKINPDCLKIATLGSLRRKVPLVGDIDIAIASEKANSILEYFTKYEGIEKIIEKGSSSSSIILNNGYQVDLIVIPLNSFGSLLQHFTGSKEHNIKLREQALKNGLSLSEYGIKTTKKSCKNNPNKKYFNKKSGLYQFEKEKDFYNAIGLNWIPPELRENRGEIKAAQISNSKRNSLPKLIEEKEIKGDLHLHSDFDTETMHDLGLSKMEEFIQEGLTLGYEYLAFTEHSPSVNNHNEDQIYDILKRKKDLIEQLNSSWKKYYENRTIKLFNSLEIDILANGKLSVIKPLKILDFGIASIHSSFRMTKIEMTKRVIYGLSDPKIKIFGHPTGRLLGDKERVGIDLNWEEVFDFCLKNNKVLEINSSPNRLDLPDSLVYEAKKFGVKMVINTDSHSSEQMKSIRYGISVARRGWLEKYDIINSLNLDQFELWLKT